MIEIDLKQAFKLRNQSPLNNLYSLDGPILDAPDDSRGSEASFFTAPTSLLRRESYEHSITSPTISESPAGSASIRPTGPLGSMNSIATDLRDISTDMEQESSAAGVLDVLTRASDLLLNLPELESILRP